MRILLLVPIVAFFACHAGAAEPPAGFTPLFDGKTLAGWPGATKGYEVVDGELRCKKGEGGKLLTEKEFADFALRFDFHLTPGTNNGLGIRAPMQGDAAYTGMQSQVREDGQPSLDGRGHPGLARTSGHDGFLGHADVAYFRNISIKELK